MFALIIAIPLTIAIVLSIFAIDLYSIGLTAPAILFTGLAVVFFTLAAFIPKLSKG